MALENSVSSSSSPRWAIWKRQLQQINHSSQPLHLTILQNTSCAFATFSSSPLRTCLWQPLDRETIAVQFRWYSASALPPERHKSSAAPTSAYLRRGPLSYFRSECCTGGESMTAHEAGHWANLFKSSARPDRESNPACQYLWHLHNLTGNNSERHKYVL